MESFWLSKVPVKLDHFTSHLQGLMNAGAKWQVESTLEAPAQMNSGKMASGQMVQWWKYFWRQVPVKRRANVHKLLDYWWRWKRERLIVTMIIIFVLCFDRKKTRRTIPGKLGEWPNALKVKFGKTIQVELSVFRFFARNIHTNYTQASGKLGAQNGLLLVLIWPLSLSLSSPFAHWFSFVHCLLVHFCHKLLTHLYVRCVHFHHSHICTQT